MREKDERVGSALPKKGPVEPRSIDVLNTIILLRTRLHSRRLDRLPISSSIDSFLQADTELEESTAKGTMTALPKY